MLLTCLLRVMDTVDVLVQLQHARTVLHTLLTEMLPVVEANNLVRLVDDNTSLDHIATVAHVLLTLMHNQSCLSIRHHAGVPTWSLHNENRVHTCR